MIEITNISKSFGDILAVDRVSVQMKEDTVFGLIRSEERRVGKECT